jgi:hypothetical protein
MLEWAWAALTLFIVTVLVFGFTACLRDGYVMLESWRAGHRS